MNTTFIKLKDLLNEGTGSGLKASDIYNFYYLWYVSGTNPQAVSTNYGREVVKNYLYNLKRKYVSLFKNILANQIEKYINRSRIDPDFPKNIINNLKNMSSGDLQKLMAKTFRTDMHRRNDVWNMVADFVNKLENSNSINDIFLYINQLNNSVHNTGTKIMNKFPNFNTELKPAFDAVDRIKSENHWELLKKLVTDKDIRDLLNQEDIT